MVWLKFQDLAKIRKFLTGETQGVVCDKSQWDACVTKDGLEGSNN